MRLHWRLTAAALSMLVLCGAGLLADDAKPAEGKKKDKEAASFGTLERMPADAAKGKAAEWLKEVNKTDAATLAQFETVWKSDKSLLEKVTDTFALGNPDAARLLTEAADPTAPPPTAVPALLKDVKQPVFFRANLTLGYAKALSGKRVFEEALDALKTVRVEQVVDPGAFLFYKAVAEHALIRREDASRTILRLLDDVTDAPERYKMVAALMHFDMLTWRDKDLGWVARMMNNIERRLDLYRGGPITQDMQKKVVLELDRMIKEMEDQQQQQGQGDGKGGKSGRNPNNNIRAQRPQDDSYGGNGSGPGQVDPKKFKEVAQNWGSLPEKERAKAILELTRGMPPKHRELIENYFKKLQQTPPEK
jgi:hypothetical protein